MREVRFPKNHIHIFNANMLEAVLGEISDLVASVGDLQIALI